MKKLIATLIAAFAGATASHADCGSCGADNAKCDAACVDGALQGYYKIQDALASDDLADAKSAAQKLRESKADSACVAEGKSHCMTLVEQAEAIANANDIAAARSAFRELSNFMIEHVEQSGSQNEKAFKAFCPMAFQNEGGAWLQRTATIRNPYYGSAMLNCGMIQSEIDGSGKPSKGKADGHGHSGHSH